MFASGGLDGRGLLLIYFLRLICLCINIFIESIKYYYRCILYILKDYIVIIFLKMGFKFNARGFRRSIYQWTLPKILTKEKSANLLAVKKKHLRCPYRFLSAVKCAGDLCLTFSQSSGKHDKRQRTAQSSTWTPSTGRLHTEDIRDGTADVGTVKGGEISSQTIPMISPAKIYFLFVTNMGSVLVTLSVFLMAGICNMFPLTITKNRQNEVEVNLLSHMTI